MQQNGLNRYFPFLIRDTNRIIIYIKSLHFFLYLKKHVFLIITEIIVKSYVTVTRWGRNDVIVSAAVYANLVGLGVIVALISMNAF